MGVSTIGRKTSAIYTKHLTRSRNIWNQRTNFKPRFRGRQPYQDWYQYPEADFPVDYYDFGDYDNITRPRSDSASRLRRQFRDNPPGRSPRVEPKWIYRPRPQDKEEDDAKPLPTFPEFPDIPPSEEPNIPIPDQDIVLDDPFTPIEEGEEAKDEGEPVEDPGRDQFPPPPTIDCQQLEMLGIPCTGNASLQISSKTPYELGKNKAYRKSRFRHNPRKTSYSRRSSHSRRIRSRLGQSRTNPTGNMPRVNKRRNRVRWYQYRRSTSIF